MIGAIVHDINFPGVTIPCYTNDKAAALKTIEEKVPLLVKYLGSKKFLVGEKPCWGDFKLYESIQLMKMLKPDFLTIYPVFHQYEKSIESLPNLGPYIASPLHAENTLPFNNVMAKLNSIVNEKGQYLGFKEVVTGNKFEKWEMKLAGNNTMFNYVSVEMGLIFQQKADIEQLKSALKAIIPKFSKAAGRMVLKDGNIVVLCHN